MRSVIFAALAFSPILLHAQALVSAQPANALHAAAAEPKMFAPAETDRGPAAKPHLRVSTGVIAPKLVHTVALAPETTSDWHWLVVGSSRKVVVSMVVDKTGQPTDLKIAQSAGAALDQNVLHAVSQYRFIPGTVSDEPTEVPVNLKVEVVNRNKR